MHISARDGLKIFKSLHFSDLFTVHISSEIFQLLQLVLFVDWGEGGGGNLVLNTKQRIRRTAPCVSRFHLFRRYGMR